MGSVVFRSLILTVVLAATFPAFAFDIPQAISRLRAEQERLSALPEQAGSLSAASKLSKGMKGPAVAALRERLAELHPELAAGLSGDSYDEAMVQAVTAFQRVNAIDPDGLAGPSTLETLNRPNGRRAERLALNIARLEALAQELAGKGYGAPSRLVVVNIPSFSLTAYQDGRPVIESKTIVGRTVTPTPALVSHFLSLKFNPDWTPAVTNEKKYLASLAKGDFKDVESHGLVVVDSAGTEIPLTQTNPEQFKAEGWRFWQPPGVKNALGAVKFEIKNRNKLDIYLHDTNERHRFARERRAFSSGCVRVERYEELAAWLIGGTVETIRAKVARKTTYWEPVPQIPVAIVYLTAAPDQNGGISWRPDVYGLDHAELAKGAKVAMR